MSLLAKPIQCGKWTLFEKTSEKLIKNSVSLSHIKTLIKHGFVLFYLCKLLINFGSFVIVFQSKKVDVIVAFMHWGMTTKQPIKSQKATAKFLRKIGVHIIVGCHTHTLQGHTFYGKYLTAYSLGNLVFGPMKTNYWVNMIIKFQASSLSYYHCHNRCHQHHYYYYHHHHYHHHCCNQHYYRYYHHHHYRYHRHYHHHHHIIIIIIVIIVIIIIITIILSSSLSSLSSLSSSSSSSSSSPSYYHHHHYRYHHHHHIIIIIIIIVIIIITIILSSSL